MKAMNPFRNSAVSLVLLAQVAVAAPETLPPTADAMAELRRIEAASYKGTVDDLRLAYQDKARQRPGDVMPRVYLAWCVQPNEDAWNQLKAILAIFPEHPWAHYGLGRIYIGWKGMADTARAEFELILKKDPRFFPALVGLGDLARLKQNWADAEEKYRAALAIADDPFAHTGLGLVLAAQQKKEQARAELRKAIEAYPEQPAALSPLIQLAIEAKDPAALTAAKALVDLRPKDRDARKTLADLLFEAGDKAAALKEYDRLVRLGNPELAVVNRLATLFREQNDAEGEERALQSAAGLDPKNPQPNLRLAQLRLAKQDSEGAESQLLEAIARDPNNAEAHEGVAQIRLARGLPHEALEESRKAVAVEPNRKESAALVQKLEADFQLPSKKARGNVTNIYWAVQATLAKFFNEKKKIKPNLTGTIRLRVRIAKTGAVEGVDVLEDTVKDPALLGHAYFGLYDAAYPKQKGEPTFEFVLGPPPKKAK